MKVWKVLGKKRKVPLTTIYLLAADLGLVYMLVQGKWRPLAVFSSLILVFIACTLLKKVFNDRDDYLFIALRALFARSGTYNMMEPTGEKHIQRTEAAGRRK